MASNNSKAAIEAEIREELKKPAGELTKADSEKFLKLNLSSTKITDANLKELAKLNQLQCLYLDYTKVTKGDVVQLQMTLPKCNILHNATQ